MENQQNNILKKFEKIEALLSKFVLALKHKFLIKFQNFLFYIPICPKLDKNYKMKYSNKFNQKVQKKIEFKCNH